MNSQSPPSNQPIELSNPTVFISLTENDNQIVLSKTQLVVVLPLKVIERPRALPVRLHARHEDGEVLRVALQRVVGRHAHPVVNWIQPLEKGSDSEDGLPEKDKHFSLPNVLASLLLFLHVVLSS